MENTVEIKDNSISEADKMGTMPVGKLLMSMAWPAILSMTINALYNIVDSIFVAQISQEALTAVSFVMPIQLLVIAITVGTGVGVNSLIARRLGAKRQKEADLAACTSIRIGILNYLIFLFIGLFLTVPFMSHYTSNPDILSAGTTYMRIVMCLSMFMSVEILLEKVLQSTGNMIIPMICSLTGAIVNLILDPILIFGLIGAPKLGVAGAAIATVIGQACSLIVSATFIKKKEHAVNIKLFGFKMDWKIFRDIYAVGLPSIIMQAIGSVMLLGYNNILSAEPIAVAVLGIYFKIQSFIFMPVFGLNQGAMPLFGYNFGARNKARLMKTYKLALIVALTIMGIGFILFQVIPEFFLRMFNADDSMMSIGVPALRRISICFLPAAFGIITATLFQGTGHGIYSLFASLIRQLFGILPLAYLLYHFYGVSASWFSFPLAEILGLSYSAIMLTHLYNKQIKQL
jgi:MATE efflux family protein